DFELGKQGLDDFPQRHMRMRQITIEPGGHVAMHSHRERPALSYVLKGQVTEHRVGAPDRVYQPGEVLSEPTSVDHWAENKGSDPAVIISVDLVKE
ncbi:MAG TPA: cupin domain-containing protein, partial [Stellaceae bacterium]|nr:cupin domain-containing protein [Stellaceae bacterium]